LTGKIFSCLPFCFVEVCFYTFFRKHLILEILFQISKKEVQKTNKLVSPIGFFNLFLMSLLYLQVPYISRENAILRVKTQNRILKSKLLYIQFHRAMI
jgi:hypothetical protein